MALPYASNKWHVAAVEGRIVKIGNKLQRVGCVRFGASEHIARIILTALKYNSNIRAALNLHYSPELIKAFRKIGFSVSSFDRSQEPAEIKAVEGKTLSWGTEQAIKKLGKVPDVIYDLGETGKEPMIRVLGSSATKVVEKTLSAIKERQQHR